MPTTSTTIPSLTETSGRSDALQAALAEWARIVGAEHVTVDGAALRDAATATLPVAAAVHAIVRPGTREEVQACARVASQRGVPIYPFSSGRNWGYGSKAPVRSGVLLDLGRMNRILDFDERLAYVTVEPGVTQRQLHEFLRSRQSRLWMDATGASPECSLIGNTLERGFGHTPMGDHSANVCGLEVVLGSGEVVQTGFARFDGSRTAALSRWGVGPSLDGLFAQSNFGIVTRMTLWLMPAPEAFQAFFFTSSDPRGIAAIIDAMQPLRMDGTLRSVAHIANDYKVVAATQQYPWDTTSTTPLAGEALARMRKALGVGYWNGSGALYGTRAQVKDARRRLRRALRGTVDRVQFVDDRLLALLTRFATPFRMVTGWNIRRSLKAMAPVYSLLKGIPVDTPLESTYWRKRAPVPASMDPDRDGCGLLWCSPVVPSTGADAIAVADLAAKIVLEAGFEPQMSISMVSERTLTCVITISYDRSVDGEDARALACYHTLTAALIERGYPPYRLNVSSMEFAASETAYSRVLASLKDALDPRGIIAPGRYVGESEDRHGR